MDKEKVFVDIKERLHSNALFNNIAVDEAAALLVDAGYGNVKQAVTEFAERLKEHRVSTKGIDIVTVKQIDILLGELYGEE